MEGEYGASENRCHVLARTLDVCWPPDTGQLCEKMKHSHNQYHYTACSTEREAGPLRAARLREAAVSGDMDLMKELKRNAQQTEER